MAQIPCAVKKLNKAPASAGESGSNGDVNRQSDANMMSLNLFSATHLPPRETVRKLATRLTTCLGITFFVVDSPAEVEKLVERVYSYYDAYNAAKKTRIKIQSIISDSNLSAFTPLPQPPTAGELCELLAMAAVGSQYEPDASASLRLTCFHSARFGLEDAMEEAEEGDSGDDACYRILRLLAFLAVYQILEKRGSCWWYIGRFTSNNWG